jgi:histone H3/H4
VQEGFFGGVPYWNAALFLLMESEDYMANLSRANQELYRRTPDETFDSLDSLAEHCRRQKEQSQDRWKAPSDLNAIVGGDRLSVSIGTDGAFLMNDWSFGQLCRLSGVAKETVNRLQPATARQVFSETLPKSNRPLQLFTQGDMLRSIHGTGYTRLHNSDVVELVRDMAVDFQPPQKAYNGGTGLYVGEQDLFCFLIDPLGWTEIDGEAFAPGFFVWNSEVGRRSFGIQTFWLQAVCQNHIVWDAVEVVEFSRKHTASVQSSFDELRRLLGALVQRRDERKDAFAKVVAKAMRETLGDDADEALKALVSHGIGSTLAKQALEIARSRGRFTIFSLVDALTRLSGEIKFVGDRMEADQKASALLALAA